VGVHHNDVTINVSFYHIVLFVDKNVSKFLTRHVLIFSGPNKMAAVNISHHIYPLIAENCSITNSLIMCIHFQRKDLSYFVINKYHLSIFVKKCQFLEDQNGG
jgi:hypothetical protein